MSTVKDIAASLAPLWQAYLIEMVKRGRTLTNDGGMADTILSSMCSGEHVLAKEDFNADGERGWDGRLKYTSRYTPTELGQKVGEYLISQRVPSPASLGRGEGEA